MYKLLKAYFSSFSSLKPKYQGSVFYIFFIFFGFLGGNLFSSALSTLSFSPFFIINGSVLLFEYVTGFIYLSFSKQSKFKRFIKTKNDCMQAKQKQSTDFGTGVLQSTKAKGSKQANQGSYQPFGQYGLHTNETILHLFYNALFFLKNGMLFGLFVDAFKVGS